MSGSPFIKPRMEDTEGWNPDWEREGLDGGPQAPVRGGKPEEAPVTLPDIEDGWGLVSDPPAMPSEVIQGCLYRGCKFALGAGSKSRKSWTLISLALSVAAGRRWLGFETVQGGVLYVNLEIQRPQFSRRLALVAEALGIPEPEARAGLDVWNLRGHVVALERMVPAMLARIQSAPRRYALIIIDPAYKLLNGRDENAAGDMSEFLNYFERLAEATGAAIAFGAHFSKGNQAGKDAMDRISGSGVFARDPDAIMTMTAHEEPDAYAVEFTLRDHAPVDPFVLRWDFPVMREAPDLDPANIKRPARGGGGRERKEPTPEDVMAHVPPEGRSARKSKVLEAVQKAGIGINRARELVAALIDDGRLFEWKVREHENGAPTKHLARTPQPLEELNMEDPE